MTFLSSLFNPQDSESSLALDRLMYSLEELLDPPFFEHFTKDYNSLCETVLSIIERGKTSIEEKRGLQSLSQKMIDHFNNKRFDDLSLGQKMLLRSITSLFNRILSLKTLPSILTGFLRTGTTLRSLRMVNELIMTRLWNASYEVKFCQHLLLRELQIPDSTKFSQLFEEMLEIEDKEPGRTELVLAGFSEKTKLQLQWRLENTTLDPSLKARLRTWLPKPLENTKCHLPSTKKSLANSLFQGRMLGYGICFGRTFTLNTTPSPDTSRKERQTRFWHAFDHRSRELIGPMSSFCNNRKIETTKKSDLELWNEDTKLLYKKNLLTDLSRKNILKNTNAFVILSELLEAHSDHNLQLQIVPFNSQVGHALSVGFAAPTYYFMDPNEVDELGNPIMHYFEKKEDLLCYVDLFLSARYPFHFLTRIREIGKEPLSEEKTLKEIQSFSFMDEDLLNKVKAQIASTLSLPEPTLILCEAEKTLNTVLQDVLFSHRHKAKIEYLIRDSYGIDPKEVFDHPVDNQIILESVFRRLHFQKMEPVMPKEEPASLSV